MVWRELAMPDGLIKSYLAVSGNLPLQWSEQRQLPLSLTFRVATVAVSPAQRQLQLLLTLLLLLTWIPVRWRRVARD